MKELKILIDKFFFLKKFGNFEFFQGIENFDWFFFFWKIKKSWYFEGVWKFLLNICSLEIFPLEYGFGDFSFEKWRIFLWKMKNFPFENGNFFFLWSQSKKDEDGLEMMKIYSWWFFFWKNLSFEWEQLWLEVNVDCWISPWLNSCKKIIWISNGFIHWNELEVLTLCP